MKINVNGIDYNLHKTPVVGICMDGTSYDYYQAAAAAMPYIQRFIKTGSLGFVKSVIPSFTNPNYMAIVTGVIPDQNGICGNYYYDKSAHKEVMMNDPAYLKVPMIINRPLNQAYSEKLASGEARNFQLFDFLHNGIEN